MKKKIKQKSRSTKKPLNVQLADALLKWTLVWWRTYRGGDLVEVGNAFLDIVTSIDPKWKERDKKRLVKLERARKVEM